MGQGVHILSIGYKNQSQWARGAGPTRCLVCTRRGGTTVTRGLTGKPKPIPLHMSPTGFGQWWPGHSTRVVQWLVIGNKHLNSTKRKRRAGDIKSDSEIQATTTVGHRTRNHLQRRWPAKQKKKPLSYSPPQDIFESTTSFTGFKL